MTVFFIPDIDDIQEAEKFYSVLKAVAVSHNGPIADRRIRSISFSRNGTPSVATVGNLDTPSREPCVAIFEAEHGGLFFIYTEGRLTGPGYTAGSSSHVEYFESATG